MPEFDVSESANGAEHAEAKVQNETTARTEVKELHGCSDYDEADRIP
ncbi:hypothetical protein P4S72_13070 [Vibrio sp. PP-XX7]